MASEALSKKVVRTFFKGRIGVNEVIIHIGEQDICMVIDPVVDRYEVSWGDAVINLIAAMGEKEIQHIGIGIDDDGDLFVKVHLPHEHVNLERFHCLLIGLCQVAEKYAASRTASQCGDHKGSLKPADRTNRSLIACHPSP